MAFDIQRSRRSLPGKSASVTFDADLSTGRGQTAQAAGELAGAVQNTAKVLNRLQAENQLSESSRQQQEILDQFQDAVEREPDSSLYPEIAKQAQEAMTQISPKNKLAKRAYGRLLNRTKAGMANTVLDVSLERERDTKRADVETNVAAGRFDLARKGVISGMGDGSYTKAQGTKRLIDIDHDEEKGFNEFVVLGREPERWLEKYTTATGLKKDFPTLTAGDFQDLRSMAQGQQRNNETAVKVQTREAVTRVTTTATKLAASGDYEGAQKELVRNIDLLGGQAFTTAMRNLKTTSELLGETGINYFAVTHKPSVREDLKRQILSGTLTDDALIYQRTGKDGISDSDAARLTKMIPAGASAKDFRDSSSATTFENMMANSFLEDPIEIEQGLRWLEDSAKEHPEWTQRQMDEEAIRIFEKVQQAGPRELPTTAAELTEFRIKAEKKTNRDIQQRIWEQMTEEERVIAMQALKQGKTPKEIIAFFEARK